MKLIKPAFSLVFIPVVIIYSFPSCKNKGISLGTTPEAVLEEMLNNPKIQGSYTGETFCWQARVGMSQYIDNYELTGDTEWLDAGIRYYDYLIGRMIIDPDGYQSWMGPYGYDENFWQDALVGDAFY